MSLVDTLITDNVYLYRVSLYNLKGNIYMVPRKVGRACISFSFLYVFSPKFFTFIKKFKSKNNTFTATTAIIFLNKTFSKLWLKNYTFKYIEDKRPVLNISHKEIFSMRLK